MLVYLWIRNIYLARNMTIIKPLNITYESLTQCVQFNKPTFRPEPPRHENVKIDKVPDLTWAIMSWLRCPVGEIQAKKCPILDRLQ